MRGEVEDVRSLVCSRGGVFFCILITVVFGNFSPCILLPLIVLPQAPSNRTNGHKPKLFQISAQGNLSFFLLHINEFINSLI